MNSNAQHAAVDNPDTPIDEATSDVATDNQAKALRKQQVLDVLERVLWTLLQAASATGIVAGLRELGQRQGWFDMSEATAALLVLLLTPVLSAIKNALAVKFGNGTASTLPDTVEPVLPAKVVAKETDSGLVVAGQAPLYDEAGEVVAGTPVQVAPSLPEQDPNGNLPDEGPDDAENVNLPMPAGFNDGTKQD